MKCIVAIVALFALVAARPPVVPSPVSIVHGPAATAVPESSGAALVQIILNINQAGAPAPVIPPAVADAPIEAPVAVDPVIVVDQAPIAPEPVIIAPAPVDPVVVVDQAPIVPEPVIVAPTPVVDVEPVLVGVPVIPDVVPEPVVIGTPVIPEPAITLPETLN